MASLTQIIDIWHLYIFTLSIKNALLLLLGKNVRIRTKMDINTCFILGNPLHL